MRHILPVVLLASVGCEGDRFLPVPVEGAASLIIVVDEQAVAYVVDAPIRLETDRDASVIALAYRETLEELGLEAGPIPRAPPEACGAKALPEADGAFLLASDARTWAPLETLPASAEIYVHGSCPCVGFREEARHLVHGGRGGAVAAIGDGAARMYIGSEAFEIRASGVTSLGPSGISGYITDAVYGPGGDVWVASTSGVWRASLDGAFAKTASIALEGAIANIDGSGPDEPLDVWLFTEAAELVRFERDGWRIIFKDPRPPVGGHQSELLEWVGPAEVYAAPADLMDLLRFDGERVQGDDVFGAVRDLRYVPALGAVVAATWGGRFEVRRGNWEDLLPGKRSFTPLAKILPWDDGFLFVTDDVVIGQYVAGFGVCERMLPLPDVTRQQDVVRLGDRVVVFASSGEGTYAILLSGAPL